VSKVYVALGSNVGQPEGHIERAIDLLRTQLDQLRVGGLYRTRPAGYTEQPEFINTAVSGTTALSPLACLHELQRMETQLGRVYRFRWGPREIDLDLIFTDHVVMDGPVLTLPHPRCHERDFVLQPIMDLDPTVTHPVLQQTVSALLAAIPAGQRSIIEQLAW
jgi:2-amino-4-hydroxy-6-hydroxymethyldihydropteridine diphosphokinase